MKQTSYNISEKMHSKILAIMSTTFTDAHSEKVLKRKRKTNNPTLQHFKELLQSCIRNLFQNTYLHEGFLSLTHNHKSTCY